MKKNMILILLNVLMLSMSSCSHDSSSPEQPVNPDTEIPSVDKGYNLSTEKIIMRDPFVFVDSTKNKYYIPARGDNRNFVMYESKDLKKWKSLGNVFSSPDEFWGTDDFWAPDMFKYKGKYYILATFSATGHKRGCTFLVSNNPEGPYHYLANKKITPEDWQTLDATLVIDNHCRPLKIAKRSLKYLKYS